MLSFTFKELIYLYLNIFLLGDKMDVVFAGLYKINL